MHAADDDLNQQNIDRFNAIAAEWDGQPRHVATASTVAEAMRAALAPTGDETLLEFGCGTGLITAALAPHVARILALDSAPGMIKALVEKLRTSRHRQRRHGEVGDLPDNPPAGRFDAIVSSMTMHHISDTDALLRVLFERLKPGGRIALADLDREDGSFHGDKPGIAHHGFDRKLLADKLSAAGFANVEFTTAHHMERTLDDGTTRSFPDFSSRGHPAGLKRAQPQRSRPVVPAGSVSSAGERRGVVRLPQAKGGMRFDLCDTVQAGRKTCAWSEKGGRPRWVMASAGSHTAEDRTLKPCRASHRRAGPVGKRARGMRQFKTGLVRISFTMISVPSVTSYES